MVKRKGTKNETWFTKHLHNKLKIEKHKP